jgi:hypothetical protein
MGNRRLAIADSVTELGSDAEGAVALAASHGGLYAVSVALGRSVAALLVHDAGVGRDQAGIGGLELAQAHGVPCAAIGHMSARIGDGRDCADRGRISHVNRLAEAAGIAVGMPVAEACEILRHAQLGPRAALHAGGSESRRRVELNAQRAVWLLDSASLVQPGDVGAVAVTASHGGLLGGRPATAIKVPVFAVLYNDAAVGADGAGISRLPVLEDRGIAGATVAAESARIGDAASTYHDGVVSFVNRQAAALGGHAGMRARDLVALLATATLERTAS